MVNKGCAWNVQIIYKLYQYKCKVATEKKTNKLYTEERHYICKSEQSSELIIKWKTNMIQKRELETVKRNN